VVAFATQLAGGKIRAREAVLELAVAAAKVLRLLVHA